MNTRSEVPRPAVERSLHVLPLILALFAASGCAALIYQIVWFQMLQLVIGSSAVSLAVLLATFMGGMCAGSLLLTKYVSQARHPLRVYAWIEGLIGVCGAALIAVMPLVARLYIAVEGAEAGIASRAIVCGLLLLPPTGLMGATLPAMSRFVQNTPSGVSWLGYFYGSNIVGAVAGCVTAGFYLLRKFDLSTAALAAVAINLVVAAFGFALSRRVPYAAPRNDGRDEQPDDVAPARRTAPAVYTAIALSGLTALGAEVVWTRLLSLMFGATTYAFSIILAVFLAALGIGSVVGSLLARATKQPRAVLGWAQLLVALATAWGAFMIAHELPWWPVDVLPATDPWLLFQVDLARALFAVLPAALLWGASFPLALAASSEGTKPQSNADAGRTVGRVYAANTFGAIAGSLVTALVLIPWIGTKGAQQVLIVLSTISGALLLLPLLGRPAKPGLGVATMTCALAVAGLYFAAQVSAAPVGLIAWGRSLSWQGAPNALYWGEGMNASIAVTEDTNGYRNFHVSGKVEASTELQDMRLQRLLGHLSALLHDNPKDVLVVGFGSGVTAGAINIHPTVEHLVICEIEPLIPKIVPRYFSAANHNVAASKKVSVVYDDARHYVLTAQQRFDVITSDPIHPWVKGAATLYTQEYFEHVKAHLNPGGVVTLWVPLYESTADVVRSELATFFSVFSNATVWRNDNNDGSGYDMVLVARLDNKPIEVDALQTRIDRPEYAEVKTSLAEVGYGSVFDLLRTYSGRSTDLRPWFEGAEINRDRNLRLQYLAGLGYRQSLGTEIRNEILTYRAFPHDLFSGSPASIAYLRELVMGPDRN
jgi:spermidine synthase